MEARRMVHLTIAVGSFHARVIAARLGADGILTELRGSVDGPYPVVSEVEVLVPVDDLDVARELLLADEVEAAFPDEARSANWRRRRVRRQWFLAAVLVLTAFCTIAVKGL
jgi:hypothetical protein